MFDGSLIEAKLNFAYRWTNRMISGDSLPVMPSLAEHEGLRGRCNPFILTLTELNLDQTDEFRHNHVM